jgi:hypothetical protein
MDSWIVKLGPLQPSSNRIKRKGRALLLYPPGLEFIVAFVVVYMLELLLFLHPT